MTDYCAPPPRTDAKMLVPTWSTGAGIKPARWTGEGINTPPPPTGVSIVMLVFNMLVVLAAPPSTPPSRVWGRCTAARANWRQQRPWRSAPASLASR